MPVCCELAQVDILQGRAERDRKNKNGGNGDLGLNMANNRVSGRLTAIL